MVLIIALIIVITYALVQEMFIRDRSARSFRSEAKVDATTAFYVLGILACLIGGPLLSSLHILEMPEFVSWIGLILLVAGIVIRVTAMLQLGKSYSRALRVTKGQALLRSGLYAYVRHPGYTGTIVAGLGFGLALGNLVSLVFIILLMTIVYLVRISNEEKMLAKAFGQDYNEYAKHTKRFIPFIF